MIGQRIGREEKQGIHGIRSLVHDSLWQKLRRVRYQEILFFARSINSRMACTAPCRPVLIDRLKRRQRDFSLSQQAARDSNVSYQGIEAVDRHPGMQIIRPVRGAALAYNDRGFER